MTRRVATVQVRAPFKEVARLLAERKISAVPVLDHDGKLAGIVSEADLLRKEQYHEDAMPTRRRFGSRRERVFRPKARGDPRTRSDGDLARTYVPLTEARRP
jgi:CBS domain-containing protein